MPPCDFVFYFWISNCINAACTTSALPCKTSDACLEAIQYCVTAANTAFLLFCISSDAYSKASPFCVTAAITTSLSCRNFFDTYSKPVHIVSQQPSPHLHLLVILPKLFRKLTPVGCNIQHRFTYEHGFKAILIVPRLGQTYCTKISLMFKGILIGLFYVLLILFDEEVFCVLWLFVV